MLKGTADRGKHQEKTVRIAEGFLYWRPQELLIEQKDDFGVEVQTGQLLVDPVQQPYILVCGQLGTAGLTFTDIVKFIRQPYMEAGDGGMLYTVFRNPVGKTFDNGFVGVAEVGVHGHSVK